MAYMNSMQNLAPCSMQSPEIANNEGRIAMRCWYLLGLAVVLAMASSCTSLPPLHQAAVNGNILQAEKLLSEGHRVSERARNGWTPLHFAVSAGNLDIAKVFVRNNADVNRVTAYGRTAMHISSLEGNIDVMEFLLDNGAPVDSTSLDESTPLFHAKNGSTVEFLVARGADVAHVNDIGDTPLHVASFWGRLGAVKTLVDNNADINWENNQGESPLDLAVIGGEVEVGTYLFSIGALNKLSLEQRNDRKRKTTEAISKSGIKTRKVIIITRRY